MMWWLTSGAANLVQIRLARHRRIYMVAALLGLASCGNSTATPSTNSDSATVTVEYTPTSDAPEAFSLVVTSTKAGIATLKQNSGSGISVGITVVDGDKHSGTLVCATDYADGGNTYHITYYGVVPAG